MPRRRNSSLLSPPMLIISLPTIAFFYSSSSDRGWSWTDWRNGTLELCDAVAIESGQTDVLRTLIASGCAINCAVMDRVDMMKVLCANYINLDVNSLDSSGRSSIHVAASGGFVDVIQFCLSKEADPKIQDMDGCTPLHVAAKYGHLDTFECLLEVTVYSKYELNKEVEIAFAIAVENGYSDLYDPLHLGDVLNRAARVNDAHRMRGCIAEGENVNGRDQNGWTTLHKTAFKGKIESVKVLIENGAAVDVVDDNVYTPLHCAVAAGHVEVVLVLIGRGAKANLKGLKAVAPWNLKRFEKDAVTEHSRTWCERNPDKKNWKSKEEDEEFLGYVDRILHISNKTAKSEPHKPSQQKLTDSV